MKRDNDLIRDLLLRFESEADYVLLMPHDLDGPERLERGHILIMIDQGLLAPIQRETFRITASGHDFLEAIRSDSIWQKTKTAVAETGGSATLDIVKQLAVGFIKQKVSKHTGIDL